MKSLLIAAELLIAGLMLLFAALFVTGVDGARIAGALGGHWIVAAGILITGAYFVGFFVNVMAERVFRPLQRRAERLGANSPPGPDSETPGQLERQEAQVRIAREIAFSAILLLTLAVLKGRPVPVVLFGALALFGAYAFHLRVVQLTASVRRSRKAPVSPRPKPLTTTVSPTPPATQLVDGVSVRALIFTGGTGFRNCNIALTRRGHRVTRVVPSWDNGGSSRALRNAFKVLSIGDIRHALMTLAHGENNSNEVIRLFNWRLSEDGDEEQLAKEMESFLAEEHPRIARVPSDLRNVILRYLETFWSNRPTDLPLHNGSIGNFVLLGAYLAHGRDMNTAIYVFRQLCGIEGQVWPMSLEGDLQLCARLEGGEIVTGEEQITDIQRPESSKRVKKTFLTCGTESPATEAPTPIAANPLAINAFADVDVIVFGPGSFFTSVLPHLMVEGMVDTLADSPRPKLFVGNMREGNECYGWALDDLVEKFLETCHAFASEKRESHCYITHILAHDSSTHQRSVRGDRYVELGDVERFRRDGIAVTVADLEDPWKRGYHDGNVLAQQIIDVHLGGQAPASA